MVGPLRIAGRNWADAATITASSWVATLPPDRMKVQDLADMWAALSSPAWFSADLAAGREIGVVAAIASNAGQTDQVRIRVSTTDPTGIAGDAYDSGPIVAAVDLRFARLVHFLPLGVIGRYVRVDLDQAVPPEVGRLVIARTWEPSRHFSFGWEPLYRDWSTSTMSLGLNLHTDRRRRQEGARFILNGITSTEFEDEIRELNRLNGASQEVLVCRDIEAANLGSVTFYGEMGQMVRSVQGQPNFFTAEFEIWNRL